MLNYFPKYFTNKAILLYFIALLAVTFVFFSRSMNVLWMVFSTSPTYLPGSGVNSPKRLSVND